MDLVIVESPAKAKTINGYLGADYRVLASYGHVRDLEAKDGAVDPDADFAMRWEASADRARQLAEIVRAARDAKRLILATDPDREGEAISWHLSEWLKARNALPQTVERVTFNAITKAAVAEAMARPRVLDDNLIDAYRARRALDYLVGFTLSPVLWRKLPSAKSAGRVQSVALRLIVDREREIEAFVAREYWTVDARLEGDATDGFTARLVLMGGRKLDKFDLANETTALAARDRVRAASFRVEAIEKKPIQRNPAPPFTTSTLQQEAARKLGFTAQTTMRTAQSLYEAGRITYMRTDGVQMAREAIEAARAEIEHRFGRDHLPDAPRHYATKAKNAQEAHEAIRPTEMGFDGRSLTGDDLRLYELIWKRTLASQMAAARLERTTVDLRDASDEIGLRVTGQVILFPGFLTLYQEGRDDAESEDDARLPRLRDGERLETRGAEAAQHFTQPPPRYGEASLVKRLEELGIGRPSTYASILQVLRDRAYVRMEQKRFLPEEKGRLVTAFLERFFERYVSYDFTAALEERLDDVSGGRIDWKQVLRDFWTDFRPAADGIMERKPSEVTQALDEFLSDYLFPAMADGSDPRLCRTCGTGRLSLKTGRFGAFIGCSNYPECRSTRPFASENGNGEGSAGPELLGHDPKTNLPVTRRAGRFGPFVQLGDAPEGGKPKRASIPKDLPEVDLEAALRLLAMPREVGRHPETDEIVLAGIGQYGPYLKHGGKYARLGSTQDAFEIGMNRAVALLAEAAQKGPRRSAAEPLRELGTGPANAPVRLMNGRYGAYVTDGTTNATVPKDVRTEALTLEEALALLAARAAAPQKRKTSGKAASSRTAAKTSAPKKSSSGKAASGTPAASAKKPKRPAAGKHPAARPPAVSKGT